jgi:1-pyrroline-5-carboxylate dehydrogenase
MGPLRHPRVGLRSRGADRECPREYELTGSVYARDPLVLESAVRKLKIGNLYLNRERTGVMISVHLFGGIKLSGRNGKSGRPHRLLDLMRANALGEQV